MKQKNEHLLATGMQTEGTQNRSQESGDQEKAGRRGSRRGVLRKWLVAAGAAIGADVLFKESTGTAHADGTEGATTFISTSAAPAVNAISNTQNHWGIQSTGPVGIITYTNEITSPPLPPGSGTAALIAASNVGYSLYATSMSGYPTVYAMNNGGAPAISGTGTTALHAINSGAPTVTTPPRGAGVFAQAGAGDGLYSTSDTGAGLVATSNSASAVYAQSYTNIGVYAVGGHAVPSTAPASAAVFAQAGANYGVYATTTNGVGIVGFESGSGTGVYGLSNTGFGMIGSSNSYIGVFGTSNSGTGVRATSQNGTALVVDGHILVQGNAVGQATLLAGSTSVTVNTSAATLTSNILLTPLGNPNGSLWVTRAAGSFTIHASVAPASDLSLAYLVIN